MSSLAPSTLMNHSKLSLLLASALCLLLAACSTTSNIPQKGDKIKANLSSSWKGDGKEGKRNIVVKLSQQRAYYYINGDEVGSSPIASGRLQFPTPTGDYKISQKEKNYQSNQYGDFVDANGKIVKKDVDSQLDTAPEGSHFEGAKMPYFMRVTNGIGFHAGYVPGYAASHGCLRLPPSMAKTFFENTPVGTPVSIVP
jgi:lipoprotein-anchoring transpeptidase ErfK/SrfK